MVIEITIKNYRRFSDESPPRIVLRKGEPIAFIGLNNAGKSSLLRFFYEFRGLFVNGGSQAHLLDSRILTHADRYVFGPLPAPILDVDEVFYNGHGRDLGVSIQLLPDSDEPPDSTGHLPLRLDITVPRGTITFTNALSLPPTHLKGRPLFLMDPMPDSPQTIHQIALGRREPDGSETNLGVPDVSSICEACRALADALYIGPFRKALSVTPRAAYYDLNIGEQFVAMWREWVGGPSRPLNTLAQQVTDTLKDLFGIGDLTIVPSDTGQTFRFYIDAVPYQLSELGGGMAQAFIVLAHAAMKKPSYILIDEPELNLHPALQLTFLAQLASYAKEGTLFATHNLGLARSTTSQIYSVRKRHQGYSEVKPFEETNDLPELLGELSYGAYHDLGYDKLLLVEGPTEVRTIQQLLRKLHKDQHVVLMPMGGRGMITRDRVPELTEIKRVAPEVQVLIDSERAAAGAPLEPLREAFVQACATVGIPCKILDWRAMENYFPDRAVKSAKGQSAQALGPFDKRIGSAWPKNENWLIATQMTKDEVLNAADLGAFLGAL